MRMIESILADAAAIAALRRDIHAHPELCFEENRTSDLIARTLEGWGIPVHRGLGKTGVVGIVRNGDSRRAVGLRGQRDPGAPTASPGAGRTAYRQCAAAGAAVRGDEAAEPRDGPAP